MAMIICCRNGVFNIFDSVKQDFVFPDGIDEDKARAFINSQPKSGIPGTADIAAPMALAKRYGTGTGMSLEVVIPNRNIDKYFR